MATAQNIQLRNPIGGKKSGFIVFLPAYKRGQSHDSVVNRRRNIERVIAGGFQTATMFDAILKRAILPQSVDLYLYRAGTDETAEPIYARAAGGDEVPTEPKTRAALADQITAGDARWDLVVTPPADAGPMSYYRAWLVAGLVALVFGAGARLYVVVAAPGNAARVGEQTDS
jgi:hypothetical protein